jgi:hypothetical protein
MFVMTAACATEVGSEPTTDVGKSSSALYMGLTWYDLVIPGGEGSYYVGRVAVATDETCGTVYVKFYVFDGYELDEAEVCFQGGSCFSSGSLSDGTNIHWFTVSVEDAFGGALYGEGNFSLSGQAQVSTSDTHQSMGTAYSGLLEGVIAFAYTCGEEPPVEDFGCTLTQGFWKTHPSAWPVSSLTIGGVSYTKAQLLSILKTSPRGDGSLILAHQMIAAMLNMASGAGSMDSFDDEMADAQSWMSSFKDGDGRLPYKVTSRSNASAFADAVEMASAMDLYNNGDYGPVHCDDAPPPPVVDESQNH